MILNAGLFLNPRIMLLAFIDLYESLKGPKHYHWATPDNSIEFLSIELKKCFEKGHFLKKAFQFLTERLGGLV
jgi:hypothetical protein